MKQRRLLWITVLPLLCLVASCGRNVRTADDITPGNPVGEKLDWRYGAADIKIQTTKITSQLMNRWYAKAGIPMHQYPKPRIIITEIDNRTDMYISTDMIRDIVEGVAANDGRFTVVVGDSHDEKELDSIMGKVQNTAKYSDTNKPKAAHASAPQLLGKLRLTKATTLSRRYDFEDYRMTMTLYDIETQEVVDSCWDILRKRVQA